MVARLHFDIPKAPSRSRQLLKIQRFSNGEVVFRITGRLQAENLPEDETNVELSRIFAARDMAAPLVFRSASKA
jgi:hypothetical protein